jgi:hypothetical protein
MRTRPSHLLVAACVAAPLLATPALAAAGTSSTVLWQTPNAAVICGVEISPTGVSSSNVLCSARKFPKPKGFNTNAGDPYVQISAKGSPKVVPISQDSYLSNTPVTLKAGTTWTRIGVTCVISATSAKCTNGAKHGFTIGSGLYKPF